MAVADMSSRHQKLQMLLRSDVAQHQGLPKEYNMDVVNHDVQNTFIFTEQDLPSYAARNKERANALAQGIPAHLLRKHYRQMEPPQPAERGKRGAPYARRPIPSRFSAFPRTAHGSTVLTRRRRENQDRGQGQARGGVHACAERRDG